MMQNMAAKLGWRLVAAALLVTTLVIYVPLSLYGLLFIAGVGVLALLLDHRNSLLLAVTLAVFTLVLEGGIRLIAGDRLTPYYRPHEMLALQKAHKPSKSIEMRMPHGDLLAIDPMFDRSLAVPREVRFYTDDLGFRNERPFSDQKLLVVGDSFVAGDGSSQEDTITTRLTAEQQIPAYNLGFQAGPFGYAERIEWARQQFPSSACVVLLMFEGNDFQLVDPAELRSRQAVPQGLQDVIKGYIHLVRDRFILSKVVYGLITRAQEIMNQRSGDAKVEAAPRSFVGTLHGEPMGFLAGYAEVTRRASFDDHGFIRDMLLRAPPDMIFFVPEKFRIYGPLLDRDGPAELPHSQWQYLSTVAAELGIDAFDLTPALSANSAELLKSGELTYWRDDTHWNGQGTSIAAREMAAALGSSGVDRCRSASPHEQLQTTQAQH